MNRASAAILRAVVFPLGVLLMAWAPLFSEDNKQAGNVTEIKIILRHIDPEAVAVQVKEMLSPRGSLSTDKTRREIIIRDLPTNIEKISRIIAGLDLPGNVNPAALSRQDLQNQYMDTIKLKTVTADKMLALLGEIFTGDIDTGDNSYRGSDGGNKAGLKLTGKVKLKALPGGNEIIIVANAEDNRRVNEVVARLDGSVKKEPLAGGGPDSGSSVQVMLLGSLKALEAVQILQTLINESSKTGAAGPGGGRNAPDYLSKNTTIVPIPSSNSLVITGQPKEIQGLISFIHRLDAPPPQVLIEVTILEVSLKNGRSIGFDFLSKKQKATTGTNFGISNQVLGGAQGAFFNFSTNYLDAVLLAIEESNDVKVLSSPHIMVTNNQKASISIGDSVVINKESLEIPTSDVSNPIVRTTHEYIDVGLKLEIVPKIGDKGDIIMEISQDVNDIKNSGVQGFPEIAKRNLKTTIITKNRESVVMGGLVNRKTSGTVSMVPVIGYIPVLGRFFRKSTSEIKTTELVLFVTASIMKNQADVSEISESQKTKMIEIRKKFMKGGENSGNKQGK